MELPIDADSFREVLESPGRSPLARRFGRHDFAHLQSIVDTDATLAFDIAERLEVDNHSGKVSHLTNNIAYWLGRADSEPRANTQSFVTEIFRSLQTVQKGDHQLRPEFIRSHLITLGNVLGDVYVREFLRQLSLREYYETNLGYFIDYYGSLPAAFGAIEQRIAAFAYPNCLVDLHTLYHSLGLFHRYFTDQTLDILVTARKHFERRDQLLIDRCLTNSRHAVRPALSMTSHTLALGLYMYDAFISHASEDKETVARPLTNSLVASGFKVWFDEYQLSAGDSLRDKIDAGLADSKYGILVLSPSFFAKGWPKAELDGLFSLQLAGRSKIIPVLHSLSHDQLLTYSPMLAGRMYLTTADGIVQVADKLVHQLA